VSGTEVEPAAGDTAFPVYDVFISHAGEDRQWVEGYLLDALTQAGVRCHHEAAFELGTPRIVAFEQAVQQSRRTLLILSAAYFASPFGQFTDLLAQTFGLESRTWPVIPVRIEDVALPPRLMLLQGLDATNPDEWEVAIERLCTELQRPLPAPAAPPSCPFPGMAPFSEDQSDCFFGRADEVEQMVQRLRLHPFLAVIGPSGSGKSSLVSAGLLPALRRSRLFGDGEWLVRTMRPAQRPMASLAGALGGNPDEPDAAVSELLSRAPGARRLLLFVDQLEELFTVATEGGTEFQEALSSLAEAGNCFVVTTARADFYPQLMTAPLWDQIGSHRLEVLPLEGRRLRPAIVRPPESVGVFVETALVERLLADAAHEPGVLPLVQETMVCLWERLERRLLPLSAYEAIVLPYQAYGGASRTGLQIAMARRADAAMSSLSTSQQTIARRILLRLVQFGEGRSDVRRQQLVSELKAGTENTREFEQVLEHLVDRRLLTLSAGPEQGAGEDGRQADLAHEALIDGWPILQAWLAERREGEQTRRRLLDKALEWRRLGAGEGGLLDQVELLEAERWLASDDAPDLGVDEEVVELVAASRAAVDQRRLQEEADHRRELDQANTLAAEQEARAQAERRRADDQARSAHQLRRLVGALAVLSLVMVAIAGFATVQRSRADRATRFAASRQLAAVSRTEERLDTSLLLSQEAYRRAPTVEARGSLLAGLERNPRLVGFLQGHDDRAGPALFSPDGTLVAAGGDDDRVIVWDVRSGRQQMSLHRRGDVRTIAFSADGATLAAAGHDKTVGLWDTRTGSPSGPAFAGNTGVVRSLAFQPHGGAMASASEGTILLWDVAGRQVLGRLDQGSPVDSVAFTPDGRRLAAASEDGRVVVWDVDTGQRLSDVVGHSDQARAVAISSDGTLLATGGNDKAVVLWDLNTFARIGEPLVGHAERVFSLSFSPDGRTLASGSRDHTVVLWDAATRQQVAPPLTGHTDSIRSVAFSPDGRTVVTASDDTSVALWRLDAGPRLATPFTANAQGVSAVAVSGDGRSVASGGVDGTVSIWDSATRTQVGETLVGAENVITGVAFSPNGRLVAAASSDGSALVWDTRTHARRQRIVADGGKPLWALAWSPDSHLLATGGAGQAIRFWDVGDGTARGRPILGESDWLAIAYSPKGRRLAGAASDGTVRMWDLGTGSDPAPGNRAGLRNAGRPVQSLAFSTDDRRLAAGSSDALVTLWDVSGSPRQLRTMGGHALGVDSVAFSPDGRTIASGGEDGGTVLWDVATGQRIGDALAGQKGAVQGVAFAPDGRTLYSGGDDGRVIVWDVAFDSWRAEACRLAHRNLLPGEWKQVGGHGSPPPSCGPR